MRMTDSVISFHPIAAARGAVSIHLNSLPYGSFLARTLVAGAFDAVIRKDHFDVAAGPDVTVVAAHIRLGKRDVEGVL
jgi:hypothetical protein